MTLSDREKLGIKGEIFDLIKEAHVLMFQYNDNLLPGWGRCAGLMKQAAGQLIPNRIGEVMDSPNEAIRRNEAAAKAKATPTQPKVAAAKVTAPKKPVTRRNRTPKKDA